MEKNFIITVINTIDMFEEAKKALLTNDAWMKCVSTQVSNRLPKENTKKHLANIINNIANYARNNYPYPGYSEQSSGLSTLSQLNTLQK